MYLHLRVKDEASAGSLYSKAGFQVYKKDCFLIQLLGQEQKYLLKKPLVMGDSSGGGDGDQAVAAQSKAPLAAVAAASAATQAAVAVAAALAMTQLMTGF